MFNQSNNLNTNLPFENLNIPVPFNNQKELRIAIVPNKMGRDYVMFNSIKQELERQNNKAKVVLFDKYDNLFLKLMDFKPTIIITFPFTGVGLSTSYYILKYILGCHIVTYRCEGTVVFDTRYSVEAFAGYDRYDSNLVDGELFWGANMAKVIGKELFEQGKIKSLNRIHVVGYPPLEGFLNKNDSYSLPPLPKNIKDRLNKMRSDNTILFVTGFHFADYKSEDILNARDMIDERGSSLDFELNTALQGAANARDTRRAWIEMIELVAQQNPDIDIIVKIHPVEAEIIDQCGEKCAYKALTLNHNIWLISECIEIGNLINQCSLLVHYGSTTAADACLQGIPTLFAFCKDVIANRTKYCYNTRSIFPSLIEAEIKDVPDYIKSHNQNPLQYRRTPEMITALDEMYNIKENEQYTPSIHFAETLLNIAAKPPLKVNSDNPFLNNTLEVKQYVSAAIRQLVFKSIAYFKEEKIDKSIEFEDLAHTLEKCSGKTSLQLHIHRANRLAYCGQIQESLNCISELNIKMSNNELTDVEPDDIQALLRALQLIESITTNPEKVNIARC
jgi:hypothetical protein